MAHCVPSVTDKFVINVICNPKSLIFWYSYFARVHNAQNFETWNVVWANLEEIIFESGKKIEYSDSVQSNSKTFIIKIKSYNNSLVDVNNNSSEGNDSNSEIY